MDPAETSEWLGSLDYVLKSKGPERVRYLVHALENRARREGVEIPIETTTPYVNTIPVSKQPAYPGNREIERRIKSIIRWNAMAMVVRGNTRYDGIGGHISTFASSATLYEVGSITFSEVAAKMVFGRHHLFPRHASLDVQSSILEGRLTEKNLENFRRELAPEGGLSSYHTTWLMPISGSTHRFDGVGSDHAIYQARFNEYLNDRGLRDTTGRKVWAFLGDGECDEPETLGAITLASREKLDNLIFVINCNLQRLDGPVRGNGKIMQELEAIFRGAGWNVIKVVWAAIGIHCSIKTSPVCWRSE